MHIIINLSFSQKFTSLKGSKKDIFVFWLINEGLKRCGKSCRLRWLNYLRPNIKHGGFSEEEDNIICNLYISIGSRFSFFFIFFPIHTCLIKHNFPIPSILNFGNWSQECLFQQPCYQNLNWSLVLFLCPLIPFKSGFQSLTR